MPRLTLAAVVLESTCDKARNLEAISRASREAATAGADLVCFPARALTGFWETSGVADQAEIVRAQVANPALVHPVGRSVVLLEALARQLGVHLAVGLIEDHDYYHLRNSVALLGPEGVAGVAAEMHTPVARHPTYVGGRECRVMDVKGAKIGVLVGDDIYYPEVARMLTLQGAQLLLACLARPVDDVASGILNWREQAVTVLSARAIENGVCVVAVEPAGAVLNEAEDVSYCFVGQAVALDSAGRRVAETVANNRPKMLMAELELPGHASARLNRRRPVLYPALTAEREEPVVPGRRPSDWDAQGELIWSRLKDLGYYGAALAGSAATAEDAAHSAVVVTAAELPSLSNYRAILLTRPCLRSVSLPELADLPRWVEAGGVLVLDGYCGRNSELLGRLVGIRGSLQHQVHLPSYQDPTRVTLRMGPTRPDPVFDGMEGRFRAKVWGQVWTAGEGAEVTARPLAHFFHPDGREGAPALYVNEVGRGRVYTFMYSTGFSQLLLTQGRGTTRDLGSFPERVAPDVPLDGDVNTWGEQVVTDAEDQCFPSADYHLIPVMNILRRATKDDLLVSPVPEGKEYGVIFTGDSDRVKADLVNRYTEILSRYRLRPTQFLLGDGYHLRELRADCEYGIHPLFHETERISFNKVLACGFEPEQLLCGRRHCLIQYGLTETLERMAECGIRYTSNNWDFPYSETHSSAFLFGTALAHHVYDWEGRRIGIVDIPQVFMDYPPVMACTQAAHRDVRRTHAVAAWNYHPQNLVMPEFVEAIEWLARQVIADEAWSGTMGEYGEWYRMRDRVCVARGPEGVTVSGEVPPGLAVLSPQQELTINGVGSRADRRSTWYGRELWVHAVPSRVRVAHPRV